MLWGRELDYLGHRQYFGSTCCERSKYLRFQHSWYPEHSNHFGSLCYEYSLYSGFNTTHHTPITRSIWAFNSRPAHTPSTRSIEREYCNTLSTSITQSIEPRNAAGTGSIGENVSNTTQTSILYHAAASRTDTPAYSSTSY